MCNRCGFFDGDKPRRSSTQREESCSRSANTRSASATASPTRPGPSSRRACWPRNREPTSSRSGTSRIASTPPSAASPTASAPAADAAVKALGWNKPYHVDADHIRLETVDGFLAASDFYTIDVADAIGQPADPAAVTAFVKRHPELADTLRIPGIDTQFDADEGRRRTDRRQVSACRPAGGSHRPAHPREEADVHPRSLDGRDRFAADARRSCS